MKETMNLVADVVAARMVSTMVDDNNDGLVVFQA